MGFVSLSLFKVFVALQLSLLFMSLSTVCAVEGPVVPVSATDRPIRKLVAVQGVVYCKPCKYHGIDTLLGASPLFGAVVKLQCNNGRRPTIVQAKTDKNGFYFIQAPKVSTYGAHKCKVFLVSSPLNSCKKPTDLHGGISGAYLRSLKPIPNIPTRFALYTVWPLAFTPTKCPR